MIVTVLPLATLLPKLTDWLMTFPSGTVSLYSAVPLATLSPLWSSLLSAPAASIPVTLGTVTISCPLDTTIVTVVPFLTCEPPATS